MANLRTLHKRQELRPTQLRSQLRQQKQEQLTSEAMIEAIVRPIMVGCDSNATPQEVEETGWLQTLRCGLVHTSRATCTKRTVDFFLVATELWCAVHCAQDRGCGPFGPHCALRLALYRDDHSLSHKVPVGPKALPVLSEELIDSSRAAELWLELSLADQLRRKLKPTQFHL